MTNVLITGGAGFIGSALCRYLAGELGWRIVNIDKLTYAANLESLASIAQLPNYTFVHADISDRAAMDSVFETERPDGIVHLAAETHVDRSITGSADFIATNIVGTFTLLEASRAYWSGLEGDARERFRFLHVSTDEVFGSLSADGLFTETTPYNPSSPYSASKAASDHLVRAWHRTYGLPIVMSNCSNNYGPYQFPEKLIPLVITNALLRRELPIYGRGANVRDWLNVNDHARALATIFTNGRPNESYNVGGRNERSNLDVVHTICDLLDELAPSQDGKNSHRERIRFVDDRPGHDFRYAIDPSKIETELSWRATETFETGLRKTAQWYIANESWWHPLRERSFTDARSGLIRKTTSAVAAAE